MSKDDRPLEGTPFSTLNLRIFTPRDDGPFKAKHFAFTVLGLERFFSPGLIDGPLGEECPSFRMLRKTLRGKLRKSRRHEKVFTAREDGPLGLRKCFRLRTMVHWINRHLMIGARSAVKVGRKDQTTSKSFYHYV